MSTSEVFMIPDNRSGQNSFDPNLLASMMNGGNGYVGNRGGIPIVEAAQSSAGSATTNAIYTLPCHVFGKGCKGIIVVNFLGATAATVTGVEISVSGSTRPLLNTKILFVITLEVVVVAECVVAVINYL